MRHFDSISGHLHNGRVAHSVTLQSKKTPHQIYYEDWKKYDYSSDRSKVIWYGEKGKNNHPELLRQIQSRSMMHSNIISVAANLIGGSIHFKYKDGRKLTPAFAEEIRQIEQNYTDWNIHQTHAERSYMIYAYGGCPVLLDWYLNLDGKRAFRISQRAFTDFRLGRAVNTFFGMKSPFHFYHYNWSCVDDDTLSGMRIKSPKTYFKSPKIRDNWIMRTPAFEIGQTKVGEAQSVTYSVLIGMPKRTNKHYPKPFFESEVFWQDAESELELSKLKRGTVKNGLKSDYIINVYRSVYQDPTGDGARHQMAEDQRSIQEDYLGFDNAGTTKINYIGLRDGSYDDKYITDGHIEVIPIPSNNNFKETESREKSIHAAIRAAHSFGVPQMAGLSDISTGFSNMAEYLLFGSEMYVNNVIRPHVQKISELYNEINQINGYGDIETCVEPSVPILKALIKEFQDCLTIDEKREKVFGMAPIESKELDDEMLEQLAEALKERLSNSSEALFGIDYNSLKAEADAYGVFVRAGSITAQKEDEIEFRKKSGLPEMSSSVTNAWNEDEGFRRSTSVKSPAINAKAEKAKEVINE